MRSEVFCFGGVAGGFGVGEDCGYPNSLGDRLFFFHSHWCRSQRSGLLGLWESGIQGIITHRLSRLLSYRLKIPDVPSLCIGLLLGWFNGGRLIKPPVAFRG